MKQWVIDEKTIEWFTGRLSADACDQLRQEVKAAKDHPPSLSGFGPVDYVPVSLLHCQEKLRNVLGKLRWLRQLNFFQDILERRARSEAKQLGKNNRLLQEQIDELTKDNQRLKGQLQTLLGVKKRDPSKRSDKNPIATVRKKTRGAPKGHRGNTRLIPDRVDDILTINPPSVCPHCNGTTIQKEASYISKYIEDIPPVLKRVTEKRYLQGTCMGCNRRVTHPAALNGPPVAIGPNVMTILTLMRQQMGVSYRKLSRFSNDLCHIDITPSGVMSIIGRVSESLAPIHKGIEARLPEQTILHADETGWKLDGKRGYLWLFCNENISFYHADKSRAARVPQAFLGTNFQGLLHSDFYGAYNAFPYTQKCLIHYLRDIKTELEISPDDTVLKTIKSQVRFIIEKGQQLQQIDDERKRGKGKAELEKILDKITGLTSNEKRVTTLIKRVTNYKDSLLNFIDHPDGRFHNNLAERQIRPAVIFRKLSFGNRSEKGAKQFAILMTVLETCRQQGKNLSTFIHTALTTPPEKIIPVVKSLLDTS